MGGMGLTSAVDIREPAWIGTWALVAGPMLSPDTVASLTSNVTVAADVSLSAEGVDSEMRLFTRLASCEQVSLFPMKSIWVDPDKVRAAPRVYK